MVAVTKNKEEEEEEEEEEEKEEEEQEEEEDEEEEEEEEDDGEEEEEKKPLSRRIMLRGVLLAVVHMHKRRTVYRDIKAREPRGVEDRPLQVKQIDFSLDGAPRRRRDGLEFSRHRGLHADRDPPGPGVLQERQCVWWACWRTSDVPPFDHSLNALPRNAAQFKHSIRH